MRHFTFIPLLCLVLGCATTSTQSSFQSSGFDIGKPSWPGGSDVVHRGPDSHSSEAEQPSERQNARPIHDLQAQAEQRASTTRDLALNARYSLPDSMLTYDRSHYGADQLFEPAKSTRHMTLFEQVASDHRQFYSGRRMAQLAVGAGVAGALANTSGDENLRDTFLDNITNVAVDEYAEEIHKAKFLGDGYYTVPVFAGLALAGRVSIGWEA